MSVVSAAAVLSQCTSASPVHESVGKSTQRGRASWLPPLGGPDPKDIK